MKQSRRRLAGSCEVIRRRRWSRRERDSMFDDTVAIIDELIATNKRVVHQTCRPPLACRLSHRLLIFTIHSNCNNQISIAPYASYRGAGNKVVIFQEFNVKNVMQFCMVFCVFLLFSGSACYFLQARVTKSSSTDFKSPSTSVPVGKLFQALISGSKLLAEFLFSISAFCFNRHAQTGVPLPDCRIHFTH